MIEARVVLNNLEEPKKILEKEGAVFKGEYEIRDIIFRSKDPNKSLTDEFLRLRIIKKNIWNEKDFIVSVKNTEEREVGKNSIVSFRKEFDTEEEAREYIEENLLDRFEFDFEFDRVGSQYDLGEDQVDLENNSGQFSMEVKSKTPEGIKKLLKLFDIKESTVLKGPSVLSIKEYLNNKIQKGMLYPNAK